MWATHRTLIFAAWHTLPIVRRSRFGFSDEVWLYSLGTGVWRSLVARFVRDEEAVGSNPATPTVSRRDRLVPATFVIPCRTASRRAAGGAGRRCCKGAGAAGVLGGPGAGPRGASAAGGRAERVARGARQADRATAEVTAQGPLHPIRRGALPTDRVQRPQSQEQTRNLRDDRRHAEGELKAKTCWFCSDLSAR